MKREKIDKIKDSITKIKKRKLRKVIMITGVVLLSGLVAACENNDMSNNQIIEVQEGIYSKYKSDENSNLNDSLNTIKEILEDHWHGYFDSAINFSHSHRAGGGSVMSSKSLEDLNSDYDEYINEYKEDDRLPEFSLGVGIINFLNGNSELGVKILEDSEEADGDIQAVRDLNLAMMYTVLAEYEKARAVFDIRTFDYEYYEYYKGYILQFIDFMDKGIIPEDKDKRRFEGEDIYPYVKAFYGIENEIWAVVYDKQHYSGVGKLNGRVTYKGEPVRGMIVYLQDDGTSGTGSGGLLNIVSSYGSYYAVTDKEGYYTIENIKEEGYDLNVADFKNKLQNTMVRLQREILNFEENKEITYDIELYDAIEITEIEYVDEDIIKISWEDDIQEPQEYSVSFGKIYDHEYENGLVYYDYMKSINTKDKYVTVDLSQLIRESVGYVNQWNDNVANPYNIIENFYLDGKYAIKVEVEDSETPYSYASGDNYGMVSNKPYAFIEFEGEKINEGDKLILNEEYEEAIAWFEEEYKKDSENLHTLKVLSTLCGETLYVGESAMYYKAQNLEKGIKYTEELVALIGDSYITSMRLGELYDEKREYNRADECYSKLATEYNRPIFYSRIGINHLKNSDFKNALKYFKLYSDNYKYEERFGHVLMTSILLNDEEGIINYSIAKGIEELELFKYYLSLDRSNYGDFFIETSKGSVKEAEDLISNDESDLGKLYKAILIIIKHENGMYELSESVDKCRELQYSMEDKHLKELLEYVARETLTINF